MLPREIKTMVLIVSTRVQAQNSLERAWPIFVEGVMTTITGPDHWDNMEKVVDDLISFLYQTDRVRAVIAAMLLGPTNGFIEEQKVRNKAIAALNEFCTKWINEKPITVACGVALAELQHPPALQWLFGEMARYGATDKDAYQNMVKQTVIMNITERGWR